MDPQLLRYRSCGMGFLRCISGVGCQVLFNRKELPSVRLGRCELNVVRLLVQ